MRPSLQGASALSCSAAAPRSVSRLSLEKRTPGHPTFAVAESAPDKSPGALPAPTNLRHPDARFSSPLEDSGYRKPRHIRPVSHGGAARNGNRSAMLLKLPPESAGKQRAPRPGVRMWSVHASFVRGRGAGVAARLRWPPGHTPRPPPRRLLGVSVDPLKKKLDSFLPMRYTASYAYRR